MTPKQDQIIATRPTKVIYREGDTVVKLFDPEYSKAAVLNEALNQARVEETDLHIPQLHEVFKIDDRWAIRSDYIEGRTLQQLMDENPEKLDEYLEQFVRLQMEIHTKRAPLLTKLKDKMHRKISDSKFEATIRFELHTRLEGMPKHKKVCHGDFNPSNVIITPDGTPFIIDYPGFIIRFANRLWQLSARIKRKSKRGYIRVHKSHCSVHDIFLLSLQRIGKLFFTGQGIAGGHTNCHRQ